MRWDVYCVIRGRGRGKGKIIICFPIVFSSPFSSPSLLLLSLPSPPSPGLLLSPPLPPPLSYPPSSSALPPFLQDYYKIGVVTCPSSESIQELREACDYLMIPFSEKTIRSQNLCKLAQEYVLVIHKRY